MAFKNKKGQIAALLIGMVLVIVFALISVFSWKALDGINDEFQLSTDLDNTSKESLNNITTSFPSVFDGLILMVIVAVWFLCMVFSWQSSDNPLLAVLGFVLLGILMLISMVLSNVWSDVTTSDPSIGGAFPLTSFFLSNYLMIILIMGASIMMITLSRSNQ